MSSKDLNKYLKYKYKYLKLKEMVGSGDDDKVNSTNPQNNLIKNVKEYST